MNRQWYVRKSRASNGYFIIKLDVSSFETDDFSSKTRQLERVLNRELPEGKQRKRKAKVTA